MRRYSRYRHSFRRQIENLFSSDAARYRYLFLIASSDFKERKSSAKKKESIPASLKILLSARPDCHSGLECRATLETPARAF
jgi:hypothetical protein